MLELEIPGDSNQGSHNKRLHWRSVANIRKKWRQKAFLSASLVWGDAPPLAGRVRVSFIVRRGRRLDPDNAASSICLKAVLDGIVEAGLLEDDTLLHCERGDVTQETGKEYKLRPSLVVRLEPVE